MAFSVKIVEGNDFETDVGSTELTGFSAGFALEDWAPAEPGEGDVSVDEALMLAVKGTSAATLAGYLQTLYNYRQKVGMYNANPAQRYAIWLRHNADGENTARQALITAMRCQQGASVYGDVAATQWIMSGYQLGLTRTPWWEAVTVATKAISAISGVGGIADYTSTTPVVGDTVARLGEFYATVGSGKQTYKLWAGFRSSKNGDRSKFQPYWSLRKGSTFGADTTGGTTNADATAKDGYKTITTFATSAALVQRVMILARDVTSSTDYQEQRGKYQVLLRAKNSAAGTVRVRLKEGYYTGGGAVKHGRLAIASTDWQFYELGAIQLPLYGSAKNVSMAQSMYYSALFIDAERTSGSCSLEMDCLVLIPSDEGFVYADKGLATTGDDNLVVQERADGKRACFTATAINMVNNAGNAILWGGVPNDVGSLVFACQRYAISTLADTVDIGLSYYPRWASLRGAE